VRGPDTLYLTYIAVLQVSDRFLALITLYSCERVVILPNPDIRVRVLRTLALPRPGLHFPALDPIDWFLIEQLESY
jgi:hypothetical protein